MSGQISDGAGDLPVLVGPAISCPWCGAGATERWVAAAERAIGRAERARDSDVRAAERQAAVRGTTQAAVPPVDYAAINAATKAICPDCERPFRVVATSADGEHTIHGARSDRDEEYLAWKARRDGGAS